MSRVYFIRDARGEHRANEADLPLRVGGSERADVVLSDPSVERIVALIAVSDGHPYIQPADDGVALYHNHERLSSSAWLKSGDQIQLGEALIYWTLKGDQVFIDATQRVTARQPVPPTDPPRCSRGWSQRRLPHRVARCSGACWRWSSPCCCWPPPSCSLPRR